MDFALAEYSARDLATSPRWLAAMLDATVEGVTAPPAAVDHVRSAIAGIDPDAVDPALVERALLGLRSLGRELAASGAHGPAQAGTVSGLFISDGGIPKTPVAEASVEIGWRGPSGDRQANRVHHGRPFQAVCLWSSEVIAALVAEGHPVAPGLTGENVTVSGLDWASLRPGMRLVAGTVTMDLSGWATPCRKNDQWFTGRSDRIDHDVHPGWSRAYAWVRKPGRVSIGDPVHLVTGG